MRTAFIEELTRQSRANPRIFLVVGDLGFSVVEAFSREFESRYLNAGVAEQNMTGLAAGLASEGYHVFTYSIANFPTFRCAEQIRNDIAYHRLPVTVVAVGGGLAYGNLGYTHHAVQDISLMRSFPGILLACPGDPAETRACVRYLCANPQPSYLRLGKAGEANVHPDEITVQPGKVVPISMREGARSAVLTTGGTLKPARDAVCGKDAVGLWDCYSMPLWNRDTAMESLEVFVARYERVMIIEDHLESGGFTAFVRECLNKRPALAARVSGLSVDPIVCGQVGTQAALSKAAGLSSDGIATALNQFPVA